MPLQGLAMAGGQAHPPRAGARSRMKLPSSSSCPQRAAALPCTRRGRSAGMLQLCLFSGEPVARKAWKKDKSVLMA